jgi:hypothetical protein
MRLLPTPFTDIRFDATEHRYFLGDVELGSVSRVLDRLKKPFDAPTHAARVAAREGKTTEQVLAEWEAKRDASAVRGSMVHGYIAARLRGDDSVPFDRLPEMAAWDGWWREHQETLRPIGVEWIVGDLALGVAGTLDALFYSVAAHAYILVDWKTNGTFNTVNRWGRKLLPPFERLDDCELVCYSLQVNLYQLILERTLGGPIKHALIVHLGRDGQPRTHVALSHELDLQQRLTRWLLPEMEVSQ